MAEINRAELANMEAVITCPECHSPNTETIPVGRCLFFYECPNCHAVLRPKTGDCCVFCSYGSRQFPSAAENSE